MRRFIATLGALSALAVPAVVGWAGPAGAIEVDTAAELRAAWDDPNETVIDIAADIMFTGCANADDHPTRPAGAAALVVNGNGHTVEQTCADHVLDSTSTNAITINDLTIVGGDEDALQVTGDLTLNDVTVRDAGQDGIEMASGTGTLTVNGGTMTGNDEDGINLDDETSVVCNACTSVGNGDDGIDGDSSSGSIRVNDSTISGNDDDGVAGDSDTELIEVTGSVVRDNGNNGVESVVAPVTVTDSDVSGNGLDEGGDGINVTDGTATVVRSTVSGNADNGVWAPDDDITIVNSTIAGNGAAGAAAAGTITVAYGTLADNGADNLETSGEIELFGTVLVRPGDGFANCEAESVTSLGYSFADDTSCSLTAEGDHEGDGLDAQLGALADNGGPGDTMLPADSSPLLDAIPADACQTGPAAGVVTDERSLTRPDVLNERCDIGAVEVQTVLPDEPRAPERPAARPVAASPTFTG